MKALITTIISLSMCLTTALAQNKAVEALNTMPKELLPYISDSQLQEMGKFTIDNDTVKVKNELNGTSTVTTINDDFAKLDLSNSVLMLIKLLPLNDSTQIICLVRTIKIPLPESSVSFYTTDWKRIRSRFGLPDTRNAGAMLYDMTQKPDTMSVDRFNELRDYLDPVTISADIPEGGDIITFKINVPFTTKEEKSKVEAIIRQKSFKWDGKSFKTC